MTANTGTIPARMSANALVRIAKENGLDIAVTWRWAGRERHGVLTVRKGEQVLFSEQFRRATQLWSRGDEGFELMRTGSPKHLCVTHAVKALQALLATDLAPQTPLPTCFMHVSAPSRPGRQPGGVSDTLID